MLVYDMVFVCFVLKAIVLAPLPKSRHLAAVSAVALVETEVTLLVSLLPPLLAQSPN